MAEAKDAAGLPAAWRVTLTWPRPPDWGMPPPGTDYVPYEVSSPERFAATMGFQCCGDVVLEAAELRSRTVRVVIRIPAVEPRSLRDWEATQSAQRAINRAMFIVQFGAKLIEGRYQRYSPVLPEPVRIRIGPLGAVSAGVADG
jgi:hypothetical protein